MTGNSVQRIGAAGLIIMVFAGLAFGQSFDEVKKATDWQVSLISGYFSGGDILATTTQTEGEPFKVDAHTAWLAGIRFGVDQEYFGWELTAAGAFADLDIKASPLATISSGRDLSVFLGDVNALYFPVGNYWADGRLRPFVTAGGGVALFDSDFDEVGTEATYDMNAGAGIKVLLGETDKYHLRLDWRWHYMTGGGGVQENIYRQELTLGFGIRF